MIDIDGMTMLCINACITMKTTMSFTIFCTKIGNILGQCRDRVGLSMVGTTGLGFSPEG